MKLRSVEEQRSLREQVSHALRAALVAGELRPGIVYSAPLLAAEFGVSATPVREAMLNLAKEGLVEVVRNKGFRVTELSEADLDDFTEIRALVEVPTVARIARTASREQLEPLRPLAKAIVAAARRRDVIKYVDADHRFHLELVGLAGNPHLVRVVGDLRKR
ncbi:GntR family transcriptional regulator, partial [Solihabitans fulvus]